MLMKKIALLKQIKEEKIERGRWKRKFAEMENQMDLAIAVDKVTNDLSKSTPEAVAVGNNDASNATADPFAAANATIAKTAVAAKATSCSSKK